MKNVFLFFFLLLLPSLAFAQEIEDVVVPAKETIDVKRLGSMTANVTLEWRFDLQGQNPRELTLETFVFKPYSFQSVEILTPLTDANFKGFEFRGNNKLGRFRVPEDGVLRLDFKIDTDFSNFEEFAGEDDAAKYLQDNRLTKPIPEVVGKAREITSGLNSREEKVIAITRWINSYLEYDLSFINKDPLVADTYRDRKGVCKDFSHLMLSMLHSIGVPARFAAGLIYSGKDWGFHGWVEVLIDGKWIPVDPTYNEAFILNAGHLKFADGFDQDDIKEKLDAVGFNIDFSKISLQRNPRVSFAFKEFENFFEMKVKAPEGEVGENSLETIRVNLNSTGLLSKPVAVPLKVHASQELKRIDADERLVYLAPGRGVVEEFVFETPEMDERFIYTFKVQAAAFGKISEATFKGRKEGIATKQGSVVIDSINLMQISDTQVRAFVTLKNNGNVGIEGGNLAIEFEGKRLEEDFGLKAGEKVELQFLLNTSKGLISGDLILKSNLGEFRQPFSIKLAPQQKSVKAEGNGLFSSDNLKYFAIGGAVIALLAVLLSFIPRK